MRRACGLFWGLNAMGRAWRENIMQKSTLVSRYAVVVVCVGFVAFAAFIVWSFYEQGKYAEERMLAEARVLDTSVNATWQFIDYEQNNINRDRDGVYNFKGIYCSLVGKSVGEIFSRDTGYEYQLRYVRENPRSAHDNPDEFELASLRSFGPEGSDSNEAYCITKDDSGEEVFRYVGAIYLTENCMDCHGGPIGEVDVTGFVKEGMNEGDLAGAVSITMPTGGYRAAANANIIRTGMLLALFLCLALVTSAVFFRRNVILPIESLADSLDEIGKGNLSAQPVYIGKTKELAEFAQGVSNMSAELDALYNALEEKVAQRTEQYKEANRQIEHQRKQLARANAMLVETNAKLKDENEYRTSIVSILSHELRTPLTAIIAYVDVYERTRSGKVDEEADECIGKIKSHSQLLLEMINNVLDLARIEAGDVQVSREPIDIVDLMDEIESLTKSLAIKKKLRFDFEIQGEIPIFAGDWYQLERILLNLTSNAVKFTDEGGMVRVLTHYEFGSEKILFEVSDTGIGISSEDIVSIFDRFTQVDASITRKYGGSGLGLSLVKKTLDLLGGSVEVESELGKGSVFTVSVPAPGFGEGEEE